jgi:hypothetical protein
LLVWGAVAALAAVGAAGAIAASGDGAGVAARGRPSAVVLVVFDEFPTTSLLGRHRRIDATRYPNFAALARDAVWFRNATSVHDSTHGAVPAILDGRLHRYVAGQRVRPGQRTLFSLLARHGFPVRASEEEADTCPRRFCRERRSTRYYLVRDRLGRFRSFIRSIRPSRRPTLYYKHTLLPHVPWTYLPSGHHYLHTPHGPIRGLNSALGVRDRGLVRLAWQRHLLQVQAVDRLLGELLQRLRDTGLYRRALVIVTADQGISFRVGNEDRRAVTRANLQDVAPVPLFVKLPGSSRGRIDRSYARISDILPTIADVLRIRIPWRTTGRSLFSRAVRRRHTVSMGSRVPRRVVTMSGGVFQRRWSRAINRQHGFFAYGRRGGLELFGSGPHNELLGRRLLEGPSGLAVGDLPVAPQGRTRALLTGERYLHDVRSDSQFRPALLAGRIVARRRSTRYLAVAVNTYVLAVGRSFHLPGRRHEQFALLVPEQIFVPGRNGARVLSVTGRRGRLRLRLLGTF